MVNVANNKPASSTSLHLSSISNKPRAADEFLGWCDRRRWWLVGAVLLLYLIGFNGQWRLMPDSAIYLTVGRNVAQGHGFTHPEGYHAWTPPGLPYLIALAFRVGGDAPMVVLDAMLLAMALSSLALVYLLIRGVWGRPMAVTVTCLLAVNKCYYGHAYGVLTEPPFLTAMMASLLGYEWFAQRRHRVIAVVLLVAGVLGMALTRSVYLVVITAMGFTLFGAAVQRYRPVKVAGFVALGLTALLAVRLFDPTLDSFFSLTMDERILLGRLTDQLPQTLWNALTVNLWELLSESAAGAAFASDFGPIPSVPLSLIVLTAGLSTFAIRRLWGVLVALFVMQWLLFIVTERYFITILPFMALGWFYQAAWVERRLDGERGRIIFASLILLWVIPNTAKIGFFVVEQRRPNFLQHYAHGRFAQLDRLAVWIQHNTPPDAILITEHPHLWPLCYLSHRRGFEPAGVPIDALKDRPFYYVERSGDRPTDQLASYGLTIVEPVCVIPIDAERRWTVWRTESLPQSSAHPNDTSIPPIVDTPHP